MQVGDLIKHKHGVMLGSGVVLAISPPDRMTNHERADTLWTSHGRTIRVSVTTMFMEVVSESR